MPCFNPYFGTPKGNEEYRVPLPCGHCEYCRSYQSKIWSFRLTCELDSHNNQALFVTLTYNDENLPEGANLSKSHLVGFFKRLRYYLDGRRIKYYACGEYGDRFGRPHYHAIIYGMTEADIPLLNLAWTFGFVRKPSAVRGESAIKYVTGYVQKKIGKLEEHKASYCNREPMFAIMSKGLGLAILDKLPHFTPFVYVGKKIQMLGRYLTRKCAEKFGVLEEYSKMAYQQFYHRWVEFYQSLGLAVLPLVLPWRECPERVAYLKANVQFERDFMSRYKIYTKNRSLDEKIKVQFIA
ncbi:MAG: replication initiator protein [Microviridae sp.]|nr:MAG: replication initiator protein [Microviridae sp.]